MKIDLGEIFGQLLQQALPQIVQAVTQQIGGNHAQSQQQGQGLIGGGAAQQTNAGFGMQQTTQPMTNMFGGAAAQTQQQENVTPEMIQALITPLAQIEQVKNALVQQMQAAGVNSLPEARPDQLPDLYRRFKEVEAQARAAGLLGGNAGGGSPSII